MNNYLLELTIGLTEGAGQLPDDFRSRHGEFLRGRQQPDGGFAGREGPSDLYYTGFGLRGLAILDQLTDEVIDNAAGFLRLRLDQQESIVDFFSLIYAAALLEVVGGASVFAAASESWPDQVAKALETLRCDDGGWAKGPGGRASSTYHTFLVLMCLEMIDRPIADRQRVVDFLLSQQGDDGGFREIRVSKRSSTNPTSAAVASLRILDALDETITDDVIDFICEMQNDEGGVLANSRIPVADVLSTFTAMVTLDTLSALDELELNRVMRFVDSLEVAEGGFFAAAWDQKVDVEYTFYGVGCKSLLARSSA